MGLGTSRLFFYHSLSSRKVDGDADCLSRMPLSIDEYVRECTEEIDQEVLQTTVSAVKAQVVGEAPPTVLNHLPDRVESDTVTHMANVDLKREQNDDSVISRVTSLKLANSYVIP